MIISIFIFNGFDKTQLMAISKEYYSLRFKLTFNNKIGCKLVAHSDYYNNFTKLTIDNLNIILLTKIKCLTFGYEFLSTNKRSYITLKQIHIEPIVT